MRVSVVVGAAVVVVDDVVGVAVVLVVDAAVEDELDAAVALVVDREVAVWDEVGETPQPAIISASPTNTVRPSAAARTRRECVFIFSSPSCIAHTHSDR